MSLRCTNRLKGCRVVLLSCKVPRRLAIGPSSSLAGPKSARKSLAWVPRARGYIVVARSCFRGRDGRELGVRGSGRRSLARDALRSKLRGLFEAHPLWSCLRGTACAWPALGGGCYDLGAAPTPAGPSLCHSLSLRELVMHVALTRRTVLDPGPRPLTGRACDASAPPRRPFRPRAPRPASVGCCIGVS